MTDLGDGLAFTPAPAPGARRGRARLATTVLTAALLAAAAACSSSGGGPTAPAPAASPSLRPIPAGPAADLSHELTGGKGVFIGAATPPGLPRNYVQDEYLATGTASSYKAVGALSGDGRWTFAPDATAPYRTRIVVRRPAKPADFSGTVVLEWLNVSGGVDADPDWTTLHEEILRRGDAWVGVSAQKIGVSGGPVLVKVSGPGTDVAGKGLKAIDPARYGSLEHPGDGFAFDIYTQVARGIRTGAGMDQLRPRHLIAAGESQSAFAMTTYYDGVQPLTKVFDGFFVHSRGGTSLPLVGSGKTADLAGSIAGKPVVFRTDLDAPVMDLQTESDVTGILGSYRARQPDSDRFRLWEVAGTAHADKHLLGPQASSIDCGVPINNGTTHIVAKAALRALTAWVASGTAPVTAPRIDVTAGATPQVKRDADGIAVGGIRTPPVTVPVATLSGAPGPSSSTICLLLGSTKPFAADRLAGLYPSKAVYMSRYTAATDATIKSGFALQEDRAALLSFADASALPH